MVIGLAQLSVAQSKSYQNILNIVPRYRIGSCYFAPRVELWIDQENIPARLFNLQ